MPAFDPIRSGLPGLDEMVDYIRMGDSVVWQVSSIEHYRFFLEPFAKQAIADGRKLIYMRFAQHPPLLEPQDGLVIHELNPELGFEPFTVAVHNIVTEAGKEAFYVFDSLSELQVAWSADLMMENFFSIICPYLLQLDTVSYFPLLRGKHSYDAIARIRDTTELLLSVFDTGTVIYLHPLKVWNRCSLNMFHPHRYDPRDGSFRPLTDGVSVSRYYTALEQSTSTVSMNQNADSWENFFESARMQYAAGGLAESTLHRMCSTMITRDPRVAALVHKHFEPTDYFAVLSRMIGTGVIGGKACGMLLARAIVRHEMPNAAEIFEPHDSYYVGSDVFYTYLVQNKCWELRIQQRTHDGYRTAAAKLREKILNGKFPDKIRAQFRHMLEHFSASPIIVRSSSLLEDGFGNAFAGKYESVFCVSLGETEERLEELENAIRTVYASMLDPSALEYRRRRHLDHDDEQMALLVQRVSGSQFGDLYFPCAAGVGYSYSAYRWLENMDPAAGMLRLVVGLGTRAVDRTEGDYPRLVGLDRPLVTTHHSMANKHRYSQHQIDVLDLKEHRIRAAKLEEIIPLMPKWYRRMVLEHDTDAEMRLREVRRWREIYFASCQGVVEERSLMNAMKMMMEVLQKEYGCPVDIEFAINFSEFGDYVINLLQCRPLQVIGRGQKIDLPEMDDKDVLFDVSGASMGHSMSEKIDVIVQVDTRGYYECPYARKPSVAAAIGAVGRHYRGSGMTRILLVPGRIGTSSPELGVPVTFADIAGFRAVCEVSDSKVGYQPELSYGSHMFQDLVESDIFYTAIFESKKTRLYQPGFFAGQKNLLPEICPQFAEFADIVKVYEPESFVLAADMVGSHTIAGIPKTN